MVFAQFLLRVAFLYYHIWDTTQVTVTQNDIHLFICHPIRTIMPSSLDPSHPSQGFLMAWILIMLTQLLLHKEANTSSQTCEMTCGCTEISAWSSAWAGVIALKLLTNSFYQIHLLFRCLFQCRASPEPLARHSYMSAAINSAHSSWFPYFSREVSLSEMRPHDLT